jgi:UDP-N-acetylglucosamine/UDP-N-acetylgalactosamine diphosphorylase
VIPWYIMTSPLNHEATTDFFEQHKCFGLRRDQIMFFQQGVMPSLDIRTGRLLLASPGAIATNPDGHGGSIRALHASGALADMRSRGVQHLSYFQVDNPLVRVIDPVFIGLHAAAADSSGEMSSKMVRKTDPGEKVGLFVRADSKTLVMEYSDMPRGLQTEREGDGLRFNAGNIAVHILSVEFLERLATDVRYQLPYHRAEKKIPFYDADSGGEVSPAENNGVKLEKFIFDALPLCKNPIVYETLRSEEFAPLKNASGVDSAESSRALQSARAAWWLERAGVRVPRKPDGSPDCLIEISPRTASSFEELRPRVPQGKSIAAGARVLL